MNLMINYKLYKIKFLKYWHSQYLIDLRPENIECRINNVCMLFIENPRINIELISGFFEFYFRSVPMDHTLGQVLTKILITYKNGNSENKSETEMMPCIIFTRGLRILEILIYTPAANFTFLKELKIHFLPKIENYCLICYDKKENIINLHKNNYNHFVCKDCLLQIDKCPICRLDLNLGSF